MSDHEAAAINDHGDEAANQRPIEARYKAIVEGHADVLAFLNIDHKVLVGVVEHLGVKGRRQGVGTAPLPLTEARRLGEFLVALVDAVEAHHREATLRDDCCDDDSLGSDPLGDLVEIFRDVYGPTTDGVRLRAALSAIEQAVNQRWLDILPDGALMCGCGDIVQTDHQCANCDTADWAAENARSDAL